MRAFGWFVILRTENWHGYKGAGVGVGWVEQSETRRGVLVEGVMGFASLNPSYESEP
jgi:hypothetical protein